VIRRCALALLSLLAACATVRTEENLVSSDPVEPAANAGTNAGAEAAASSAIDHSDLIDDGASYPRPPLSSGWQLSSGYRWTSVGYSIGPTSFALSACTSGALPYYYGSAFDDVPYPDVRGGFFPAGSNGARDALGGPPLGWYPYGVGCAPAYYVGSPSATGTRASWTHPLDTALVFTTARAAIRPLGTGVRGLMGVVAPELAGGLGRAESGDVRRAEPRTAEPRTADRVATKAPAAEGESRGQPRTEPRAAQAPGPARSPTTSVGRRF
jgi:hypothetical protein